jgi:hypothetical protein
MYIVISFDFAGSSNVTLHAMTNDESVAHQVYEDQAAKPDSQIRSPSDLEHQDFHRLVELVEIDPEIFTSMDSTYTFFWENIHNIPKGVRVIKTNNV